MLTLTHNKFFNYYFPLLLSIILLATAGFFWYARPARAGYTYSRTIQTTAAQIPGTLANFTILVCANGAAPCDASVPGLNQSGGGAHVTDAQGDDIVFSSLSDCSSGLLNWEMEKYVAATGEMYAWVRISSLTSSTNQIYMCYGNSAITTFQGGATGTAWDAGYAGVWHLPNGTILSATDSTSNANNGSITGATAVSGQVNGGANFNGIDQKIDLDSSKFPSAYPLTFSMWLNTSASTAAGLIPFGVYNNTDNNANNRIIFEWQDFPTTGNLAWNLRDGSSEVEIIYNTTTNDGNWHYVVGVSRSANDHEFYVDGMSRGTSNTSITFPTGMNAAQFARRVDPSPNDNWFPGKEDETRVSNVVRSADWITTEYNNQSNPGSFITFGSESNTSSSPAKTGNYVQQGGKFRQRGGKMVIGKRVITFTKVQSSTDSDNTVSLNNVGAGNLIVAYVKWEGNTSGDASISDGTSSFAMSTRVDHSNNDLQGQFGYLLNANSGARTYTATLPGGNSFARFIVTEFSVSGGVVSFDQQNIGSGTSAALSTGNITTAGVNELVLGSHGEYAAVTTSAEAINSQTATEVIREPTSGNYTSVWYKGFSSAFTGNSTATLSGSEDWIANIISFKAQ